jgi:hypothetical protein
MPGAQRLALRQNGLPCDNGWLGMISDVMKRFLAGTLALAACMAALPTAGHAEEEGIDKAKAVAFDIRMFGNPPGNKAFACFVRRFDGEHLAQHPGQKVRAMKLLMSAQIPSDEKTTNHSFRLGVKFRHRSGDFDSSGECSHVVIEEAGNEIRFGCGVDCDGGGIGVALSKDDKSAVVRLERVRIWQNSKPDEEAGDALVAGADDAMFRLDRVEARECASLVTDRKELAALRRK